MNINVPKNRSPKYLRAVSRSPYDHSVEGTERVLTETEIKHPPVAQ